MLSVRVTAPDELVDVIAGELDGYPTVANLVRLSVPTDAEGAPVAASEARSLLMFDLAREDANNVMRMLRHRGVPAAGSIAVSEPLTIVSDAASAAERAAPGHPADGIIWAQLADHSREDARPSWSFFAFLLLATLIAGIGRVLDQPILIIGAMVVGPEFAPIAAISFAIVRRRRGIILPALGTLFGGFAACAAVAWGLWALLYALGLISFAQATTGPQTEFIITPDAWSFVIALLAGIAGVLSLTSSKSSALVGVFISITTVPAVGTIGLTAAVGAWDETLSALIQLGINLAGLFVAGIATLWVQLRISRALGSLVARRRRLD